MGLHMKNAIPYGSGPNAANQLSIVDTEGILGTAGATTNTQLLADGLATHNIPVSQGGTGATTVATAQANLQVPANGTLATVENGSTASQPHSVGDFIFRNGSLYRVKTAMSAGDSIDDKIDPATTVGAEISKLNSTIDDRYSILPVSITTSNSSSMTAIKSGRLGVIDISNTGTLANATWTTIGQIKSSSNYPALPSRCIVFSGNAQEFCEVIVSTNGVIQAYNGFSQKIYYGGTITYLRGTALS